MKAASLGLKEAVVDFGMFGFGLVCVVGKYAAAEKYALWKHENPRVVLDNSKPISGCIFQKRSYDSIIWLPRVPRTPHDLGTLSHEVMHAVSTMMSRADIPLSEDAEEAYCYAMGFAVRKILEGLRK